MSINFIINLQLYKDSIIGAYTLFRDSICNSSFALLQLADRLVATRILPYYSGGYFVGSVLG